MRSLQRVLALHKQAAKDASLDKIREAVKSRETLRPLVVKAMDVIPPVGKVDRRFDGLLERLEGELSGAKYFGLQLQSWLESWEEQQKEGQRILVRMPQEALARHEKLSALLESLGDAPELEAVRDAVQKVVDFFDKV